MSNHLLDRVFGLRVKLRSTERLVLLALADRCNGAGVCWPGLAEIAGRTGLTVRGVRKILRRLERAQLVRSGTRRGYRPGSPRAAKTCPACHAVWIDGATCPECDYVLRPAGRMVETLAGELVELGAGAEPAVQDQLVFYAELRGFAAERGFKTGWAAHKFRERHGTFPPWAWNELPVVAPSPATRGWVRSRYIAWRKSGGRAA